MADDFVIKHTPGKEIGHAVVEDGKGFANLANILTIHDDFIYNGSRLYIPVAYRKRVIEKPHKTHHGITALKCLVKNSSWWPLMNKDIDNFVKDCEECNRTRTQLKY